MGTVKTTKPTRAQRAEQTRRRMIQAATREFVSRGYAATTMNDIAARADVAVQTLYYSFRTKALLLREAMETVALGANAPAPITERPWMAEIMGGASAQRILALTAEHGTDVYQCAAPLWPAVRAASLTDPTIDEYWRDVSRARRDGMRQIVAKIAEHRRCEPGCPRTRRPTSLTRWPATTPFRTWYSRQAGPSPNSKHGSTKRSCSNYPARPPSNARLPKD